MTVQLEAWHVITFVSMLVGAFWGLGRMLIAANGKSIDEKFAAVQASLKGADETARRLERDLMELRAELPRDYVRREDYTQAIATIMTKIDAVALRMEQVIRDAYQRAGQVGGT